MAAVTRTDWDRLLQLPGWTPLREVPNPVLIAPTLYRLSEGAYVLAQDYNRALEDDPGAPFVTELLWASSDGAARRAAMDDIDADDGASSVPPPSLWHKGNAPSYASVLREAGKQAEYATYRLDDRFVHKVVDLGGSRFFFRSLQFDEEERPYAIAFQLP